MPKIFQGLAAPVSRLQNILKPTLVAFRLCCWQPNANPRLPGTLFHRSCDCPKPLGFCEMLQNVGQVGVGAIKVDREARPRVRDSRPGTPCQAAGGVPPGPKSLAFRVSMPKFRMKS
jgi:hypothetical protein